MSEDKSNFWKELAASPWKGMVTEVGFGIPFSYYALGSLKNSDTILYAHAPCLYFTDLKLATKESLIILLDDMQKIKDEGYKHSKTPRFYLAVSGSFKDINDSEESHGWIGLRTVIPRESADEVTDTYVHFNLDKTCIKPEQIFQRSFQRTEVTCFDAGYTVAGIMVWLLKAIVLGNFESWGHAIQQLPHQDTCHVDVIEDPRISLEEQISLANFSNPLFFQKGSFHPVSDCWKNFDKFMSGTFSSVTKTHEAMSAGAACLMNFETIDGEKISYSSMSERVSMIDAIERPVLIIKDREYFALQAHLLSRVIDRPITFIVGNETFNSITDPNKLPEGSTKFIQGLKDEEAKTAREKILTDFLKPIYKDSKISFEVFVREGQEIIPNQWNEKINYSVKSF